MNTQNYKNPYTKKKLYTLSETTVLFMLHFRCTCTRDNWINH